MNLFVFCFPVGNNAESKTATAEFVAASFTGSPAMLAAGIVALVGNCGGEKSFWATPGEH
ncbi:hypothetical protein [Hymenobacter qilianensis]|uniref:hypothetical protein n=1 Tax=Hymenobacter qilianensis TaxID=1385715 RepID=UPI00166C656A|nr:hypothetical protein [Hymenobacter qilianensis]